MTGREIVILSDATEAETAAVRLAVERLTGALGDRAAPACRFQVVGPEDPAAERAEVIILSLLPEALDDTPDRATTEARLRQSISARTRPGARVYLCTAFRHVGPDEPPGLRARIRWLNLLAAELSRETGIFLIDIDRRLADAGAQAYRTDLRLGGPMAMEPVAREIAATLLGTGLETGLPREASEALKAVMSGWHPPRATVAGAGFTLQGMGGMSARFQTKEAQAADTLRKVLRGRIPPHQAAALAAAVIRRQGFGGFARLAWRGLRQGLARR